MARNPNPTRISDPLWTFWLRFDAAEPTALLGGIIALKPGYHSYRSRLSSSDYSSGRDLAADKLGPADKASAIDLTMSTAAMIKHTRRLDKAARARDPRLYTSRGPVLREFIGTLDGKTVYCYVLTGGRALGVGADAGPDPGRDKSHLWHLHLSIIRLFAGDQAALDGVLSVLIGESLAAWQARTQEGHMLDDDDIRKLITRDVWPNGYPDAEKNPTIALGTFVKNVGRDTYATQRAVASLTAQLSAMEARAVARDAAQDKLLERMLAAAGNPLTAGQFAEVKELMREAANEAGAAAVETLSAQLDHHHQAVVDAARANAEVLTRPQGS